MVETFPAGTYVFKVNPLTTNVPHYIKTSQLISNTNQLTVF